MIAPLPIQAATISMADSLILMVLALVVFGPRKLPQIGRTVGKLMYEFRKASNDFKFQMEEEFRAAEEADRRKREEAERQSQAALNPPAVEPAAETTTPAEIAASTSADDAHNPYVGYAEYVKEQENAGDAASEIAPAETSAKPSAPVETAILETPALPTVESPLAPSATVADTAETATTNFPTEPVERHG